MWLSGDLSPLSNSLRAFYYSAPPQNYQTLRRLFWPHGLWEKVNWRRFPYWSWPLNPVLVVPGRIPDEVSSKSDNAVKSRCFHSLRSRAAAVKTVDLLARGCLGWAWGLTEKLWLLTLCFLCELCLWQGHDACIADLVYDAIDNRASQ